MCMFSISFGSVRAKVGALFAPPKPIGFDEVLVMLESQAKACATKKLFDDWEDQAPSWIMDEFVWDSAYLKPEDVSQASELLREIFESWWNLPTEVLGRLTVHLDRASRHLLWLCSPRRDRRDKHTALSRLVARLHGWRSAFFLCTARHARFRLLGRVPGEATSPSSAQAYLTPLARPA